VGNFDRQELRNSSGVTGAAPIFHDVLLAAQARVAGRLPDVSDAPIVDPVAELAAVRMCALSGLHAGTACPAVEVEWLPRDAPPVSCSWHRHQGDRVAVSLPAVYQSWGRTRGLVSDDPPASPPGLLRIVNPPDGAVYLRDPTLRGEFQSLALRATAATPEVVLRWEVDGQPVGTSRSGALDWPLRTGTHTIVVSDARGQQDRTTIVVR
jgi:penicillin-binding protein 1C